MRWIRRLLAELRQPLFRNAYALLLSSVLTSGLGLVYWAAAARLYPATDVGIGASLVSVLIFVGGISQLNLQSALYRYVPQAGSNAGRLVAGIYAWVVSSAVVVGLATVAIGATFSLVPSDITDVGPAEYAVFVGSVVVWSLFAFQDYVLASLRLTVWVPVESFIFAAAKLGLLVATVGIHPFGVFVSWMVPAVVGVIAVSGAIWLYLRHLHRPAKATITITAREVARFAAGDYLAGIFSTASSALMPVLVFIMLGPLASGHFYPVWLITVMLWLVPSAMMSSLLVEASAGHAEFGREGRRVLVLVALTIGPPIVLLVIAAPFVLQLFGAEYAEAGSVPMRLLALSTVPFVIKTFANYYSRFRGDVRRVVLTEAAIAIPSLAVAVVLMPILGITGVALAVLGGQTTVGAVLLATVMRPVISGWRSET